MNGTTTRSDRSVQLAVMASPTTSLVEAVAEARRRHGSAAASIRSTRRIFEGGRGVPAVAGAVA
jgi:hypothetical protein